jgi:hypothetical protein
MTDSNLKNEAKKATKMIKGKVVSIVLRHRLGEFGIEFTDGTRLFVDRIKDGLEISITEDHHQNENT